MQKALFGQCNGDSWNDFESRTCSDVVLFSWYQNERGEVEEGKTQRHDADDAASAVRVRSTPPTADKEISTCTRISWYVLK